jgi:hypothetical protein
LLLHDPKPRIPQLNILDLLLLVILEFNLLILPLDRALILALLIRLLDIVQVGIWQEGGEGVAVDAGFGGRGGGNGGLEGYGGLGEGDGGVDGGLAVGWSFRGGLGIFSFLGMLALFSGLCLRFQLVIEGFTLEAGGGFLAVCLLALYYT